MDLVRLSDSVRTRRRALGMRTSADLAIAAGLSLRTVAEIERGATLVGETSQRAIEAALGWEPGEMVRIAEGGDRRRTVLEDVAALREVMAEMDDLRARAEAILERLER
ncbi:MAG TPA: hypothetical protein VN088_21465 [Nocardioides sp.]|nr:hypothetical protein [Nocardioides sp.]